MDFVILLTRKVTGSLFFEDGDKLCSVIYYDLHWAIQRGSRDDLDIFCQLRDFLELVI